MKKVKILSTSVFVDYGYVQHAGREWRGELCTWFHSYLIPDDHDLRHAIAYEEGIGTGAE